MIIPDANLLIFAYDQTSPFHKASKSWLEKCLSGKEQIGLAYPVLFAFFRIATSSRIFSHPMSAEEAASHINSWRNRSVTQVLHPPGSYFDDVHKLLNAAGSAGANLVTDAQIAAL